MKLHKLFKPLALAGLSLALSTAGFATQANATFGFIPFGTVTVSPGNDLMTATSVLFPSSWLINTCPTTAFANPNDFCAPDNVGNDLSLTFVTISPASFDLTGPNDTSMSLSFNGAAYTFNAVTLEVITTNTSSRNIGLYFLGTFSGTGWDSGPASASFSFTQSSPGGAINGSATFSTPPEEIPTGAPEPASMALLGSALVGVGVFGRKKLARR